MFALAGDLGRMRLSKEGYVHNRDRLAADRYVVDFEPDAEPAIAPKPGAPPLSSGYVLACTAGSTEHQQAQDLLEKLREVAARLSLRSSK